MMSSVILKARQYVSSTDHESNLCRCLGGLPSILSKQVSVHGDQALTTCNAMVPFINTCWLHIFLNETAKNFSILVQYCSYNKKKKQFFPSRSTLDILRGW